MEKSYSQIYLQIVFSVKRRKRLLNATIRPRLFEYIAGIISAKKQRVYIVGGWEDHIHILVSIKPNIVISDLVRDIKNNSSKFLNENQLLPHPLYWNEGFGVFSYNKDQVSRVYNYILNQEEHHSKQTFKEEYFQFLKDFDIEYDERYLFREDLET